MTQNHDRWGEMLWAYHDQQLSAPEIRELKGHLADCSQCCQQLAQWRKFSKVFFRTSSVPVPEGFTERVMERLGLDERPSAFWNWRWLVPTAAFGLASLLLLARPGPEQEVSTEALLLVNGTESSSAELILTSDQNEEAVLQHLMEEEL